MRMAGLRDRTKNYALRVIKLYSATPKYVEAQVMGKQLLRSGTSVAANFREASRVQSDAEFIAKPGIVEQELDESLLWLELLVESTIMSEHLLAELMKESDELIRIVVRSIQSTKAEK
ncbi:MAG: four helix bundle protein [Planctomycetaceae bacterium]